MSKEGKDRLDTNHESVLIEHEMKQSYLDYAMSVIVSRALPDVRDGLKPVHRRIIYGMQENGYTHNKPFKKSARIVGEVMGKYHPHGDSAIYDSMVRMAQDFSMRLPLIDGQGNFGSMDGDNAAAMRYTEARLSLAAQALVEDIDKETVAFKPNYDDSLLEPEVLPARYPNLLVNGASGIAVGMATNILPHNLNELVDACCKLVENRDMSVEEIKNYVKGPDFPTGSIILGNSGINSYLTTGRGSVKVRGKLRVEELKKDRYQIIITEIPWLVNKAKLVEDISLLKNKTSKDVSFDFVSAIRDESDKYGIRIVVELKKDVEPEIAINTLYKQTNLQTSYGVNMLAINKGIPEMMNVKEMLLAFVDFREEVIRNRTLYLLNQARNKAYILAGLGVAVANIDEVIELIKSAKSSEEAKEKLMAKSWPAYDIAPYIELLDDPNQKVVEGNYKLSEEQAKAILDLRLHRLTGLEREKIIEDLKELSEKIKEFLNILNNRDVLLGILKGDLQEAKRQFGKPRKTEIGEDLTSDVNEMDFIQDEDVVVTITEKGYIKRMSVSSYRTQKRGGKGKKGLRTKEDDFVANLFMATTHQDLLFFTSKGVVFKLPCYKIPDSSNTSLGRAIVNLLNIPKGDSVTAVLNIPKNAKEDDNMIFATKFGTVRRNTLSSFSNVNANGKIAMKFEKTDDELIGVQLVGRDTDILISTVKGKVIRFPIEELRVFASRNSLGVKAIKLQKDDRVINLSHINHDDLEADKRQDYIKNSRAIKRGEALDLEFLSKEEFDALAKKEELILTITSNGFGKISSAYEYRTTARGGSGVMGIELTKKTGDIVAFFNINVDDEIIMSSNQGIVIRINTGDIRVAGRKTQGVKVFNLNEGEEIVSVSAVLSVDEESESAQSVQNIKNEVVEPIVNTKNTVANEQEENLHKEEERKEASPSIEKKEEEPVHKPESPLHEEEGTTPVNKENKSGSPDGDDDPSSQGSLF